MGGRTVVSDDEDEIEEEADGREEKEGVDLDGREDDDDEEDEEEDGQDEYEKDGFIVDDVEEEEEDDEEERKDDSDEERHRKKKKKRRETERNYELDEDDYELLQDNNIGFTRPKPGSKFKRLKKAGRDSDLEQRSGFSDEEESDRNSRGGHRTAEEKLKLSLFGDDEGAPLEDIAEEQEQPEEEEDEEIGEDDDMRDFIVDEDDVNEHGDVVKRKKIKKKKVRQAPGVSSSALQEAHEIFGDVDELLLLRKQGIAKTDMVVGFSEKRLEDEFEPFILSEKYMTPKDDAIREADVPERIQLSEEITGSPPTDDESIEEESAWIHNQLITGISAT